MKFFLGLGLSLILFSCSKNENITKEEKSPIIIRTEQSIIINNPVESGTETSNEVVDLGVLSKVGQRLAKRVYINNKTGGSLNLDFSDISGIGLSISSSTCSVSLKAGSFCYFDLDYELLSSSQVGLSNIVADIVSNDPVGAGVDWAKLSIVGNVSSEINDGLVKLSEVSVSESIIGFGNLKEGEKRQKRLYISNSSVSDIEDLSISLNAPFSIIGNRCNSIIKAKRLCSIDIEYNFNSGEVANEDLSISFGSGNVLPLISVSASSRTENTNTQFVSSYGLNEHDGNSETNNDPEIDLSNIGVGNTKIVRLHFLNSNGDYDFSGKEPSAVGDIIIKRNTCVGVIKEGVYCYIDVEYTRNEVPAGETNLIVADESNGNIKFDFALPVGVFDESYFGSAVFE